MQTTAYGITYPTPSDPTPVSAWFKAIGESTDAAIAKISGTVSDAAAQAAAASSAASDAAASARSASLDAAASASAASDAQAAASSLKIGSVNTAPSGGQASASITISGADRLLNLSLPVSVTAATASALAPGAQPTATLNGTTLALGIPGATADDATVAALIGGANSTTSKLDGRYLSAPYLPTLQVSGDATAQIQNFLNAANPSSVRRIIGTATINGTVAVPAGIQVDLSDAKLTQVKPKVSMFTLAAGAGITGGDLYGVGTDFVPQTGSIVMDAIGVRVVGDGASVKGTKFTGFASAAIYVAQFNGFTCDGVTIVGVDGYNGVTIPAGDSACFGLWFNGVCSRCNLKNFEISKTSIGVINSPGCMDFRVSNGFIHDIPGQHGLYLQDGTGLAVTNMVGRNIYYNFVKVQLSPTSSVDSASTVISNITGRNIGTSGGDGSTVAIMHSSTDITTAKRFRGVSISNVTAVDNFRGVYLMCLRGASISNITCENTTADAFTILDSQDTVVDGVSVRGAGKNGVIVVNRTGAVTQRLAFSNIKIHDAAKSATASNQYGFYVVGLADGNDCRDISIDGMTVTCSHSGMLYALFFGQGHQESFRLRNADLSGQNGAYPVRLISASRDVGEWANVRLYGLSPLYFPTQRATYCGSIGVAQSYFTDSASGPVTGSFVARDRVYRLTPPPGSPEGWVCTTSGGASSATWAASTQYAAGVWVRTSAGKVLECTTAGTSGTTEPAPASVGDSVADGSAVWAYRSASSAVFKAMSNVSA